MRILPFFLVLLAVSLKAQEKTKLWTQEVYRTGSILNYERSLDGQQEAQFSNQSVNNIIYNNYVEVNDVYARVDLTLITFALFNNDQNTHWSYNFTVGAFLNEEALNIGSSRHYIGVGADFDLSNSSIYVGPGSKKDFSSGTIGLNFRWDIEIGDHVLVQNNLTRAWWGMDDSEKWDYKLVLAVETFEGLFITASPNYLYTKRTAEENGLQLQETASHFYWTFGLGFEL